MAIGESVQARDAVDRVTGALPYGANLRLPGMLHAKVLRSAVPHGRITHLDVTAAEQTPGVIAVLTASDLGKPNGPQRNSGAMKKDQPVLAYDRVRYIGEPVAAIAEEALLAIEVDYEELPAVYDAVEAVDPQAPRLHEAVAGNVFAHRKLRHGDLEAGFAAADVIVEETFTSPVAQHVSLEPHVTVAQWHPEGRLTVWSTAQAPFLVRSTLAELFGLEPDAVRMIVPPLGGGYGGKGHVRIEPLTAALAWKVGGRPVKLALTRAEEFVTVTKHAATVEIKSGVKRDGTFTARQVTIYWNGGAYADVSPALVGAGMVRAVGPYRIPNVHVDSYGIHTNLPPAGAFRGAMSSQGTWAYESHMDTIAYRLGLDPLAYRLKEALVDGDTFATGETLHDIHFVECLRACTKGLGNREEAPAPARRRGHGVAVMMKSTMPTSRSECRLAINAQGEMTLYTSAVEMGQGAHTVLAQIAADAVGLPLATVAVVGPDTAQSPYDASTSASRATNMMGTAILNGAAKLKEELRELAAPLLEYQPQELAVAGGFVTVATHPEQRVSYAEIIARHGLAEVSAVGRHQTKGGLDPETGQGLATPHWHQGAGACEVEVDTETGQVTVLRYHAASYAGRVVNPQMARLQNEGNVIFGLGPALMEEMVFDHGQIVNANLSDYLIPSFLDAPRELHTVSLEAEGAEFHGIGEMTLPPVAPAIANAIYDAVGVRIADLPITAEKVLRALQNER